MTEEEKLYEFIYTEISSFVFDLVNFYYKRENECIRKIIEKTNLLPENFVTMIAYAPITQLLVNQHKICFDSLKNKDISEIEFREAFFEILRKAFNESLDSIKRKNNLIN